MVTRFFNDVIFREEDVIKHGSFLPGDLIEYADIADEPCELFLVRVGEELKKEGESHD